MDKLAHAVAVAETANCTRGIATWSNNCHGILTSAHEPIVFTSTGASFGAFKALWMRSYGGFPDIAKTRKYVGWMNCGWLNTVAKTYNRW